MRELAVGVTTQFVARDDSVRVVVERELERLREGPGRACAGRGSWS